MPWDDDEDRFSARPNEQRIFATTSSGAARAEAVGPPVPILFGAAVATVVAFALLAVGGSPGHILGWGAGSLLTLGLVTMYTTVDARRSESTRYLPRPRLSLVRAVVLALGVLAAGLHAWHYATYLAS